MTFCDIPFEFHFIYIYLFFSSPSWDKCFKINISGSAETLFQTVIFGEEEEPAAVQRGRDRVSK